jgi:hypothetical protein
MDSLMLLFDTLKQIQLLIYDIKTSRNGWNATAKGDSIKMAQLIAYKNYFSKQFGMPIDNIELNFLLLKER